MKPVNHPFWMFVTVLVPVLLFFIKCFDVYDTIESQLSSENTLYWMSFLIVGGLYYGGFLIYALWLLKSKKSMSLISGLLVLVLNVVLLFTFFVIDSDLIPFKIARWIVSRNNMSLYALTVFIPGALWGMLIVIAHQIQKQKQTRYLRSFGIIFGIPIVWYIFFAGILPLFGSWSSDTFWLILPVTLIACTVWFIYLVIKMLYGVLSRKEFSDDTILWRLKFPVLLVLPLVGLIVSEKAIPVFGNFSSWVYYALAAVNGVLFLLPEPKSGSKSLLLLVARAVTYTYIVYFFLVFLPYLPLSIIAILAVGFGFLMLSPLVAMVICTKVLYSHYVQVREEYGAIRVVPLLVMGMMVLPLCQWYTAERDRDTFEKMMEYAYDSKGHSINFPVDDLESLSKSISILEGIQSKRDFSNKSIDYQPYLTPFYNWYVFNNLTLSDKKIATLKNLFMNETPKNKNMYQQSNWSRRTTRDSDVEIQSVEVEQDTSLNVPGVHSAWIHFILRNKGGSNSEYRTTFNLPKDVFVSDYYLVVEGKKKYGILAERRTALWVYQNIVNTLRDPGILRFIKSSDVLDFRVFPFVANGTRRTGFKVEYKSDQAIQIDDTTIQLKAGEGQKSIERMGNGIVVPANVVKTLPVVLQPIKYHFILDASAGAKDSLEGVVRPAENLTRELKKFMQNKYVSDHPAEFLVMNYSGYRVDSENWENKYIESEKQGGLFLERAVKNILIQNYLTSRDTLPVIVVVSDVNSVLTVNSPMYQFGITHPGQEFFYQLNSRGEFSTRRFTNLNDRVLGITNIKQPDSVRIFTTDTGDRYYASKRDKPQAVMFPYAVNASDDIGAGAKQQSTWDTGAEIALAEMQSELFQNNSQEEWQNTLKKSFASRVLSHQTAFIVLENEMQEKALLKKQQQVLSGNKNMDIGSEEEMSEPEFYVLLVIGMGVLGIQGWRRRRRLL